MKIWTDSSYSERERIAGFGIVIQEGEKERTFSGWIPCYSNNYGELFAIYLACVLSGNKESEIYTDSQTALDVINNTYPKKSRIDFETQRKYENYMQMMVLGYKIRKFDNIKFEKVKAHKKTYKKNHLYNGMADLQAKIRLSKYFQKRY